MSRYLVHLYVFNTVVPKVTSNNKNTDEIADFHKIVKCNNFTKAIDIFTKYVEIEKKRWEIFNNIVNKESNTSVIITKDKDERGIYEYFFIITSVGDLSIVSQKNISKIWIEDTESSAQGHDNKHIR